ncbi:MULTISPECIES: hypothetical protein [Pseudomonas syringae group]|uniref:hypothetical protein n=1 Tax=Pseudomonas syringae group TaxID=136849 RepID=UPI0009B13F76|nr:MULTISPECIES: hypothetical protein [Pseudomonas syringae group]ARA80361.1 hypothetical protein B5U27_09965 [Pseudomonas amygdali pv. lachrymans]MCK9715180.1 hypothetical protein [Pseudomonas syringae pv. syringae]MCK9764273.1 hypothetical protein [Pseudomonas syringae pv. syringae]
MGSTKEWMMDRENQKMREWMSKEFDVSEDIDEDTQEWEYMTNAYQNKIDAEDHEAEMQWFEDHPYHEIYDAYTIRMHQLQNMLSNDSDSYLDQMKHQMMYSHAVTLFEAMVGDIIKASVKKFPHMMERLTKGCADLETEKYTLKDIIKHNGVEGIAMLKLNDLTFHNIKNVEQYVNILSENKLSSVHKADMFKITSMRHDFVHRNGATKDGEYHKINGKTVDYTIEKILLYSVDVYKAISDAAEKRNNAKF